MEHGSKRFLSATDSIISGNFRPTGDDAHGIGSVVSGES
jgi:hypothetical protein